MNETGDAEPGTRAPGHPAVRRASGARYAGTRPLGELGARASESDDGGGATRRRAAMDPANLSMMDTRKSRVYSLVTLLPVLMLVAGLFVHFRTESVQSGGAPIASAASVASGTLEGLSVVGSGRGRHFLWFEDVERGRRGVRLTPGQARLLKGALSPGDALVLDIAPTVEGSNVQWLWRVRRGEEVLLDDAGRLR